MKYRILGTTGLAVSRISLGTMTFGNRDWGCDAPTSRQLMDDYVAAGGNFIDTADIYAGGESEKIIGEWLSSQNREDLVIATKCFFRTRPGSLSRGLSRKHILAACEASLRRLRTDFVDLYYMHGPDHTTPLEESMAAMDALVCSGKVRYLACSNLAAWQVVKANAAAQAAHGARFTCGQYLYNLTVREAERDILPACADQGMGCVAWSPLAGGLLTGKYARSAQPPPDTRIGRRAKIDVPRFWHEHGFKVAESLRAVGVRTGISPTQLALAWVLKNGGITAVIIGASHTAQLAENLRTGDWDLSGELKTELDGISAWDCGHLAHFAGMARTTPSEAEF